MIRVQKRDGTLQSFALKKIRRALLVVFSEHSSEVPNLLPLINRICERLDIINESIVSVETIQDTLESVLMESGHTEVAKAFILYRANRSQIRERRLKPDNRALADYIHAAKYARYMPELGRRETYSETVERVRRMHVNNFPQIETELNDAFDLVHDYRVLPSMRSMQFAGSAVEQHNARMYNCSFTLIDRPRVFQEIFYLLLCGCGVGYSVQWCHVDSLQPIQRINRRHVKHHSIADSIIGWADAVGWLINSYLFGYHIEFDYSSIRPEGSPIQTGGGRAPGHLGLKRCLDLVRSVLDGAQGRKLRPIECHDIICYIAEAVLSGGIRRSSLICLFSPEDTEMIYAKAQGNFRPAFGGDVGLNSHRQMANNSAVLIRQDKDVFERIIRVAQENFGDPGFVFSSNRDYGTNPCGEIGLNPRLSSGETGFAFCNLCEINGALCDSPDDFYRAAYTATVIGTVQATYTSFPYLGQVTEQIARRDALLGIGIMGLANKPDLFFKRQDVLKTGALVCHNINAQIANKLSISPAKRITTVKPGGTAPLEASAKVLVGSGIHPHHARRYFRRVTANPNEPVAQRFSQVNPHMVETKPNGDWSIIFPQEVDGDCITIKEQSALEFLGTVYHVYENWVKPGTNGWSEDGLTHNVSATVTIRDGELEEVIDDVWNHRHKISSLSFAPYTLDQKFAFAPRQEILTPEDEAKWNSIIENYIPIDWKDFKEAGDRTELRSEPACVSGACEF